MKIKNSKEEMFKIIADALEYLNSNVKVLDQGDSLKLINNLKKNNSKFDNLWKVPKTNFTWHITTYFKGKSDDFKNNPAYVEYNDGQEVNISIEGIIYLPLGLISLFTRSYDFYCNNEIPHITCMVNQYLSPKHSNDALTQAFKGKFDNLNGGVKKGFVYIDNYEYHCYYFFFKEKINLTGIMTSFDS